MSIIYGTLERLESDEPPLTSSRERASSTGQAVEPRGLPIKTLVTALLFALTGANLLLWYWSHEAGARHYSTPAAVPNQTVVPEISDHRPASAAAVSTAAVSTGAASTGAVSTAAVSTAAVDTPAKPLESSESNSGTATEREAAAMKSVPAGEIVEANAQPDTEVQGASRPESIEESVALADESVSQVSSMVLKPGAVSAESANPIQIFSSNTVRQAGIEEVIEGARLALSRGQYQQALQSLERLQPIPDNRPDFWLIKGSAHLGNGQLDLAEVAFTSAQLLAPDNVQIALQQAILKQEKGDHAGALHILKALADRHPDVPEIFLNQGHSLYALGAEREARRSFRVFLRLTEGRSLYMQQRKAIKEWLTPESPVQG